MARKKARRGVKGLGWSDRKAEDGGARAGAGRGPTLAGFLFLLSVATGALSILIGERQDVFEEMERTVRRARATLVSTEVKEWIPGRNHWSAFGTFDIVAGDYTGRAEGSLIPSSFYRGKPRRYRVPREEAETFLPRWEVGKTYDGFWDPEYPSGVFFEMVDARANARSIWLLRGTAVLLLALSAVAAVRRHAQGQGSRSSV